MATKTKSPRRTTATRPLPSGLKSTLDTLSTNPGSLTKDDAVKALQRLSALKLPNTPLKTPSTDLTSELNNIDFKKMIGGPLQACVDAQVASSLATIDFINKVGFIDNNGKKELVMVDFSHVRKDVDADGKEQAKEVNIKVPLLAMLPIPSLRIDHAIIDFNVKLNSVETSQVEDSIGVDAELKVGWGPVNFKVSASYQRKSTTGVEVKKEYALNVNVKVVQDEIPAGLEKILNMLAA
jgi:hypothetical protein